MLKKTYKVKGMNCASCASLIELGLEDNGIKARCSFAKEELEVEFDPTKIDEVKIRKSVRSVGYDLI